MHMYGGDSPMVWLTGTPGPVVRACIAMLPRLEAEGHLGRVNEIGVALGGGSLAKRWQRVANGELESSSPPARRDPSELIQLGFKVRRIPKSKKTKKTAST